MARKTQSKIVNAEGVLTFSQDRSAPTSLYGVEAKQMRSGCSTTPQLVEMYDLEAIGPTRVIRRAMRRTQSRTQGKSPDTPHPIDANPHNETPFLVKPVDS